ncbi:hypothetical protein BpOF4_21404 (plasmid) [Alkalihalophilus pseudofirmus OF4]|uniref:Uncharacterized protein n=1 Tax=Alkalihalophilus pseudofirmus (strain ATCC BAA-2126 / JCM 17055 / OF4) TaxID=398511 RepID=D3G1Q0_ALKPO|nr:hypothetical protein [Alkalihalophilus pseudofirmus]ADC52276.1 hypothetical protein BpOF4_21404 [Alkalihalophilus pseudofirmus OF4]
MNKKYSEVDLLGLKRHLQSGRSSFLYKFRYRRFFSREVTFSLRLPSTYLDRGEILCEDIERLIEEEVEIEHLLSMILLDFLKKMSKLGAMAAFQYLVDRYSKVLRIAHYKGEEEEFELIQKPREPFETCEVTLHHNVAYRLELFLAELDHTFAHEMTVEKLIEIVYCHMIETVKTDGGATFTKAFIKYLKT